MSKQSNTGFGIPARFTPIVFSFYMALLMSLFMCFVIVAINSGLSGDYLARVLHTWQIAMPTAFFVVLTVRPLVMKLVALTVRRPT
ncbi:DUF2798 domain-containing protein [Rhizobium alvei]|uniref:DUF2798 domain-containing protein n=1 Tax=Rhizobium alvei TaxID=1132659 RepID=A0ABT8YPB6_9HYPH|nr:DUF2798 domain-containing protein [Rhizobium alvei]MDO6965547.1 DUF2798 domain-containing protein [Rhizobium alvei]